MKNMQGNMLIMAASETIRDVIYEGGFSLRQLMHKIKYSRNILNKTFLFSKKYVLAFKVAVKIS